MKDLIIPLLELCDVDRELHALKSQLALYPKMLADMDAREAAAKRAIAAAEEKFVKGREARRRAELEVQSLREKIAKYQVQQTQVKTNKEYEAITHEIEAVKNKIGDADLEGIEGMEREEQGEKEKVETAKAFEDLKTNNDIERARIAQQTEEKKMRATQFDSERKRRFSALPEEHQELYQLLNDRYPGGAMSAVHDGHCTGCGMNIIRHVATDIRAADKMIRCESCMRILYDPVNAGV